MTTISLPAGITVAQAAERAGITRIAARKRLRRGSWRAWKVDGEWRIDPASVDQEAGPDAAPALDSPVAPPADSPAGSAAAPDTAPDMGSPAALDAPLLDVLRDEVNYLRRKLDERDEEVRRLTVTLAQAVARLPQLPAPESPMESPMDSAPEAPAPAAGEPAPSVSHQRPWWRFW